MKRPGSLEMIKLPRVVILGRPNVGKSTLFNRICGRRRALVGNEPGMTRDRIYAAADWRGKAFEVVDTGGIIPGEKDMIALEIFRQARVAIEEAEHLVLVVDAREGVVPLDEQLAQLLHRTGKPLSLAVNKVDSLMHSPLAADFHRLGVRDIFTLSAEHGLGVDELLDHVTARFPVEAETVKEVEAPVAPLPAEGLPTTINVAIIGRPNVGKSTLLNRFLNAERSIVTPLPGTTRDAVDAEVERDGLVFRFVDTAGIRRKGKTKLLAEKLSVIQARKHLERADVALLLIDALEGVTAVDAHIGGYAHESGRSVVLVINKWDAVPKGPDTAREYTETVRRRMKFLGYAPIVFVSALTGERLKKLADTIVQVAAGRRQRVSTAEMNRFLEQINLERIPAPAGPGGRPLRIYYLTQAGVEPPTFVAFTNRSGKLHFSVERNLENRLREKFGFVGAPIVIKSRRSK